KLEIAFPRILREQVDEALSCLKNGELGKNEAIHECRKCMKKIRGLARLYRGSLGKDYRRINTTFRDTARILSDLRDRGVLLETFHALNDFVDRNLLKSPGVRAFEQHLQEEFERVESDPDLGADQKMKDAAKRLKKARKDFKDCAPSSEGFDSIQDGLQKTYKRGRKGLPRARENPTTENFHDWRKRVKYHRYHMRVLQNLWKPPIKARRKELKELTDLIGDEHDLALLDSAIRDSAHEFMTYEEIERLREAIAQRRDVLRGAAILVGEKIYAEKKSKLSRRIRSYWKTWVSEKETQAFSLSS
ncbi:MAG: CHAD domain-containing protein, partial [Candidatus Omnitrophica bacterium]|nr:CHAD domain-containing protein [Candidatus Omnitrophota bacterium]